MASVLMALPGIVLDAPQGVVHVDRDNRHSYLTPRIGLSNAAGGFDIIYEAPGPVRPDPYLVWQIPMRQTTAPQEPLLEDRSMNEQVFQNFRDMRVAVLHVPDANRQILADTLAKLGLRTTLLDPHDEDRRACNLVGSVDILFFDADAIEDNLAGYGWGAASIPLVAVLGLETPSRLQRTFEHGPSALLHKPLRPTGIYTALFFAVNEFRRRQSLVARLADVEARHGARRFVVKALLTLAERHKIDDEEAFRMLRLQSMKQRLTVEEMAIRIVASRYGGSSRNALRA